MRARRVAPLAGFGLAGLAAGVAASLLVAPRYQASAFVVVDGGGREGSAIASLHDELLNPARLEAVAESLTPYPSRAGSSPSSRAENGARLLEDLEVRERGEGTLEVRYTHADPGTARDVPNRLVALLVEEALASAPEAEDSSVETADPDLDSDSELAGLARRIDETRARIERRQRESPGSAPRGEVGQLQEQLRALDEDLRTAALHVSDLRAALETHRPAPPPGATPSPVEELQAELAALRTRYTDQHPDVQRLLARLRRAEEVEARATPAAGPAPDRTALLAAEEELAGLRAERARVLAAAGSAAAERARVARADDETITLIREHRRLQERYVALKAERAQGGRGGAARSTAPAPRVRLDTPARWPREPSSPSRSLYAVLGLIVGLALGGVVGSLVDRYDDRIREPAEVEALLRAPQLADIPEIRVSRRERDRHRRLRQVR